MTIGDTYIWTDRDRSSISLTAVNRKTDSRTEFYLNRRFRFLPDCYLYQSEKDDNGGELRFSFRWLWLAMNLSICNLKGEVDEEESRQWGWYFLDRCFNVGFGKKLPGWELPFVTTACLTSQILSISRNRVVFSDRNHDGTRKPWDFKAQQQAIDENSETFDYTYELNNGEKQQVKAKVHVSRHVRRWKWTPFVKNDDSIWVEFSEEVGPERGSWKGGCTGCGWTMRKGETVRACLRRMEQTRRFERR